MIADECGDYCVIGSDADFHGKQLVDDQAQGTGKAGENHDVHRLFLVVDFSAVVFVCHAVFYRPPIFPLINPMNMIPDLIGYLAATLTTVSFLPQAILTLKTRDTDALSLGMYSLFTSGVLLWLIYGIYLANPAIIAANAVTLLLASLILSFKIYNTLRK